MALDETKYNIEKNYEKESLMIETKMLTGNKTADRYTCMQSIISFCTEVGSRLAYIDYLTNIYNRNALERDLNKNLDPKKTYYFLADLNDLKLVNDTIGHSAGDKLLQGFARLLTDAVGNNGRAYRQGGDEFAVLYDKDAQIFVQDLEKRCRDYNQSSPVLISYAIGYCLLEDPNFRDVADQMMYEDKRHKKQARPKAYAYQAASR